MGRIGEQLTAPNGYRGLNKEHTYIYLSPVGDDASLLLCTFDQHGKEVYLEYMKRAHFESGVLDEKIVSRIPQTHYPDWLDPIAIESDAPKNKFSFEQYKATHEKSVDLKFKRIETLLSDQRSIISSADPFKIIKRFARKNGCNEKRVCYEFFLVVAYRGSKWALLPLSFGSGTYERKPSYDGNKLGPKSKSKGPEYGFVRTKTMDQTIYKGYDKFSGQGQAMTKIWRESLTKLFGCRSRKTGRTKFEFYHPSGEPFPSVDQFRNTVIAHYGIDRVRTDKRGEQMIRNKKRPSKGSFSADVSNAMERIEADGYFLPEVPKGERDGNPMPPMCVVRIRCVTSGIFGGVGFSIGGETADAYRAALFCMALNKSEFGRLFGMEISDEEWPTSGLPSSIVVDRGPGSVQDLLKDLSDKVTFRGLPPTYAGQSKAVIESSNPKNVNVSGGPSFIESDLTYTQLAKREILRTVRDNVRMDVSSRLTPDMIRAKVEGNPLSIYNYLESRYRNDSVPVNFSDAVRSLLSPVELTVDGSGAHLHRVQYNSDCLAETGILDRAVGTGSFKMSGYTIPLCVRQVWIDVKGKLVECQAQLKMRDDPRQLSISLSDIQHLEELSKAAARDDGESRIAADAAFAQRFEELTGKDWDAGTIRSGKPKRNTAAAKNEFGDTRKTGTGKS